MPVNVKCPKTLGEAGRKRWKWAAESGGIEGTEPLLAQLCHVEDRLAEVRAAQKDRPPDARMISAEVKLLGQFTTIWRLLGLADTDAAPGRVGYPENVPRTPRRAR